MQNVINIEAEMRAGEPIMLPEGKAFEKRYADGRVELFDGLATKEPTGRYVLTYSDGTTEIVDQERAETERRKLVGSFAAAQAEAIRQQVAQG